MGRWVAFGLLAALVGGYAAWTYWRRELPIRGRGFLAALRGTTLVALLLLLWNPAVPGRAALGDRGPWILVDGSSSMAAAPAGASRSPRDSALALVRAKPGASVLTFGASVELVAPGADLPTPRGERSLLTPALERAAEAGAREVTVVSDLRLDDPVSVEAALGRLGLDVRWVDLGTDLRNAGVEEFILPATLNGGAAPEAEVVIFASGQGEGDSLTVDVLEEGVVVSSRAVAAPSPGRRARVLVTLPPPRAEGGRVRYEARVGLRGDVHPDDDARPAYVVVAGEEGAVVLISLAPDFEPRYLLPVLASVTGLRPRAYLRIAPDRFLLAGNEGDHGIVTAAPVIRAAAAAELLVLHGVGADAPSWVRDAAAASPRLLLLPADAGGAALGGVETGGSRPGEWYVADDLPPSPLAREMAGLPLATLPPLGPLLVSASGDRDASAVLRMQLRGTGPGLPGLVLVRRPDGRVATALAGGFWRWAFRPGAPRDSYRRLWSGVAGWLLGESARPAGAGVAPTSYVLAAGDPPTWAGGGAGDSVRIRVSRGDSVVSDTTVGSWEGLVRTPLLPSGTYTWASRGGADSVDGRFDVAPALELAPPRMTPLSARPAGSGGPGGAPPRRPVRTHPLPYLLLLALLAVEWTLRRRRGLR